MRRRRPLENGTLMPSFLDGTMVSRVEELERTARALERLGLTSSAAAGAYERRYLLDGWGAENVPGTRAATRLYRFGNAAVWQRGAVLGRAGRITGLGVAVSDPRTAGTATLEIWLAGSATGVTAVLDDTSTTGAWEVADVSFEVGELIELYLTTSGWTPTGADIQAMLEVVLT